MYRLIDSGVYRIKLLGNMGFDKDLVKRANEKAERYSTEGRWG